MMGRERTVNSEADLGQRGRVRLALLTCRVLVSERSARNLTSLRSCLMKEGSSWSLVQDALRVQLVGALSGQVGSETLVGMAKRSVWTPLLSRSEGPRMRSCQQRPASGQGRFQLKAWRLLTSSRSGLILDCWGLNSLATVGLCRLCALMQKRAVRR